jgi:hypothetical protein
MSVYSVPVSPFDCQHKSEVTLKAEASRISMSIFRVAEYFRISRVFV